MRCVVIDLEMNQPSGAVIQVAGVCVDLRSCRVVSKFDKFCALPWGEVLNPYITELTGILPSQVEQGVAASYRLVLEDFWEYVVASGCRQVAAWGTDVVQLKSDARNIGITLPKKVRELDIKSMYQILKCGLPSSKVRGGLRDTLDKLGMEFIGKQHNALHDSYNTARLLVYARELQYLFHQIQHQKIRTLEVGGLLET